MTPFSLLASLAGLSHREAAEFLGVRLDTVKSWASGRRDCGREPVLADLRALIETQGRAAREALTVITQGQPDEIEIGYPHDDEESRALGWPCVGAWAAMAARVLAATDRPVLLVPRGSTVASAAAIEARQ